MKQGPLIFPVHPASTNTQLVSYTLWIMLELLAIEAADEYFS